MVRIKSLVCCALKKSFGRYIHHEGQTKLMHCKHFLKECDRPYNYWRQGKISSVNNNMPMQMGVQLLWTEKVSFQRNITALYSLLLSHNTLVRTLISFTSIQFGQSNKRATACTLANIPCSASWMKEKFFPWVGRCHVFCELHEVCCA